MIHPSADVSPDAVIGDGTAIWHRAHVRERARIGSDCIIGKDAYIDVDVVIGSRVKIQNGALVYRGATLEDGVFIGPQVVVANDEFPRAITPEGKLKRAADWTTGEVRVCYGASLGAGVIVLPGVTIGSFALVGAGSVVTRSVPPHGIAIGNPARRVGWVCPSAHPLTRDGESWICSRCGWAMESPAESSSPAPVARSDRDGKPGGSA